MNCTAEEMQELTRDDCWSLLCAADVGRLAVCVLDRPDVFPVNYVVDDRSIVFRTAEGTKLAAAVLGRSVAFEIDGYDPAAGEAWSVVAKGPAIELGTMTELFAAEDLPLFPWQAAPKPRYVRIRPEEVSGRRFRVAVAS
jgi:nitroimidazol reductase NimA-like FMN-containing flavoprotein (pyridoxamine 5'-phosphate oxidase superfamily)